MTSMDFTMGSTATIETKLGKSLDDIIKTGSSKPAGSPAKKKAVPVKAKAKVVTVPRKQQQGNRAGPGPRGAAAAKGKGNVQARLQKVGAGPNGRPGAQVRNEAASPLAVAALRLLPPSRTVSFLREKRPLLL